MYEKPPADFLVSFGLLYSDIMLSAVLWCSLVRDRWVILRRVGSLVVVLVLASAFLHVKVSVKVVRVLLGNVTCFWSTFVLGGGG